MSNYVSRYANQRATWIANGDGMSPSNIMALFQEADAEIEQLRTELELTTSALHRACTQPFPGYDRKAIGRTDFVLVKYHLRHAAADKLPKEKEGGK